MGEGLAVAKCPWIKGLKKGVIHRLLNMISDAQIHSIVFTMKWFERLSLSLGNNKNISLGTRKSKSLV